jgi:hypothetical protein
MPAGRSTSITANATGRSKIDGAIRGLTGGTTNVAFLPAILHVAAIIEFGFWRVILIGRHREAARSRKHHSNDYQSFHWFPQS